MIQTVRKTLPDFLKNKPISIIVLILVLIGAMFATTIASFGIVGGALLIIAVTAPLALYSIIKYPKFGITAYIIMAYFVMLIISLGVNFPLGTLMDGILVLLIIGFLIDQKLNPNREIFSNPISIMIIIWIAYNFLEVANPSAASRMAWVYTIRSLALVMLSYFVFMYQINTISFIRLIIKIWLALSVVAALYGLKQEFFGFSDFEVQNLNNDPLVSALLFIDGHWRKFSIFAEPVSFSYNMNIAAIICICLIIGPTSKKLKILLAFLAMLFYYAMLFSGTRAAFVLLPVALILLFILKLNYKMVLIGVAISVAFGILIFMPTTNYTIYRFQTAFKPSDDASYTVRKLNQKRIQPFIQSHPMGGGLGASGAPGVRFSPGSFLATFPPDSGYVRSAVEQGWIGLALICALFFVAIKQGINNYFKIKDPELKTYCLAMTLILFALSVGNFPQEAIVQFPLNVYFCLYMALINVTLSLDKRKQDGLAI